MPIWTAMCGPCCASWKIKGVSRRDAEEADGMGEVSDLYNRDFSALFIDAAKALARTRMTPTTSAVLWWSLGNLHPTEWTLATHDEIAICIGGTRSAVTKSLLELQRRGLIQKGERGSLRLSMYLCWQGTQQAYRKQRSDRKNEIVMTRAMLEALAEPVSDTGVGFFRIIRYWRGCRA